MGQYQAVAAAPSPFCEIPSHTAARTILRAWQRYQARQCLRVIREDRAGFERLGGMDLYFLDERPLPWDYQGLLNDMAVA